MSNRPQAFTIELTEWEFNRLCLVTATELEYYAHLDRANYRLEKEQEIIRDRWRELYKKFTTAQARVVALSQT